MWDIDSTQTHNHHPLQDAVFKHSSQLGNKIEDFSFLRNQNAEVEQTELWNLASHLWVQAGFQYVNVVRWNLSLWHLSYSVLWKVYIRFAISWSFCPDRYLPLPALFVPAWYTSMSNLWEVSMFLVIAAAIAAANSWRELHDKFYAKSK